MSFTLNLLPTTTVPASALLGILYKTTTAPSTTNPAAALQQAERGEAKGVAAAAANPVTAREIAGFRAAVAKAADLKSLLADPLARKVFLTANGLGDQVGYPALAVKALSSDTTKDGSLASRLGNPAWLATAKTFDFANQGLAVLKQPKVLDSIAHGYAEVTWRNSLDAATPGLSNALAFREQASGVTTVDQILGNAALRTVVTTALGIPKQIAYQPLEAQEKAVASRLDVTRLKDPAFVEDLARRYLVANAAATTPSAPGLII